LQETLKFFIGGKDIW